MEAAAVPSSIERYNRDVDGQTKCASGPLKQIKGGHVELRPPRDSLFIATYVGETQMTKRLAEWDKAQLKMAREHQRELNKGRAIPQQKRRAPIPISPPTDWNAVRE